VTQPEKELPDVKNQELLASRKRQVWQVVLVMTLSFCIGIVLFMLILWWVFQKISP
jgi:plastocyanin domain-containing protein